MAITVAKYTFGSYLRKGIGGRITETDNLGSGAPVGGERAKVEVGVTLNGTPINRTFELLGPGDIIGINPAMIVRTEPLNLITNFEPNYLPFIEFYDEDFIWRYTPAKAAGNTLRPWLVLVVLKEEATPEASEFVLNEKGIPLPVVTVKSADALPPHNQTWAWSHVHVNEGHNSKTEFEEFLRSLHDLDHPNSDKIICRLVCPRKLETNKGYRAFLVPAFETGRLAGLGLDPAGTDAQAPSWVAGGANIELPVYYQWYFRTGENEDFESLVKILEPRVMDKRIGIRDMNGSAPGFGLTHPANLGDVEEPNEATPFVIGLEGALMAPTTKSSPQAVDTTRPFFPALQKIVNFPAALRKATNNSVDPVVSPPIYGENHARQDELDITKDGWMHTLNRDPRTRVSAGFGTNVVQKHQEDYVARAWTQVQRILEANRKILFTAFSMHFAQLIKSNFVQKLAPEKTLLFFSPLLKKVKGSPTTLQFQMEESILPPAAVSTAFRRLLRPRGPFHKRLVAADPTFDHSTIIRDLNDGKISAAPPKQTPVDIANVDAITKDLPGEKLHPLLAWLVKNNLLVLLILLGLFLLLAIITGLWILLIALALVAVGLYIYSNRLQGLLHQKEAFNDPQTMAEVIEQTGPQPAFTFTETDPVVTETSAGSTTVSAVTVPSSSTPNAITFTTVSTKTSGTAGQDNMEAAHFRSAALILNKRLQIKVPEKVYKPYNIANAYQKLTEATDPRVVFPRMIASMVYFSFNRDWLLKFEHLVPAMAYPDFPDPMYEKLRDISSELLIPNLNLIPPNTISLLVTNPPFIESYMVGLNHEFGKELLWREYPTDKRGSYFRQFWDVKGIITIEEGLSAEQLTEKYKDVKPLDQWGTISKLGQHNNRNPSGKKQVVLVVRGELLKKYPNTIIYAQKAHIAKEGGVPKPDKEPVIIEVETEAQMAEEIKFPMFKAEVSPDIKFFGFDLTIPQAQGAADPRTEGDDWGYYFVIQQIPGEPRFGMDVKFDPDEDNSTPITWDDMGWDKYTPTKSFISTAVKPSGFTPAGPGEDINQWGENAARMAYILYQKPVMIAVHAKEMLKDLE